MNRADQRAAVTAGPRELVTRAYFTGHADGLGGRGPHYRAPRALPRKRADLLALLYARGYRRGRLAADLPMPASTIRDELTENPHMSSTPDTVDVEPPKTREGNGYPHAARTPQ